VRYTLTLAVRQWNTVTSSPQTLIQTFADTYVQPTKSTLILVSRPPRLGETTQASRLFFVDAMQSSIAPLRFWFSLSIGGEKSSTLVLTLPQRADFAYTVAQDTTMALSCFTHGPSTNKLRALAHKECLNMQTTLSLPCAARIHGLPLVRTALQSVKSARSPSDAPIVCTRFAL
jgi:hypothetical protein